MAGTDEAVAADEDALYVLTATLLTPPQFPSVLGDDYPEACAALGLVPLAEGYGLVLGQDSDGARWTVAVDDVSLVAVAIASWDCGMEYDLSPDDRTVVAALPGWPLALDVAAPGIPAPHDPEPDPDTEGAQVLRPPDTSAWGPAQRRLGADEVALQWATWRAQLDDSDVIQDSTDDTDGTAAVSEAAAADTASDTETAAEAADADAGTDADAHDVESAGTEDSDARPESAEDAEAGAESAEEVADDSAQDDEAAPTQDTERISSQEDGESKGGAGSSHLHAGVRRVLTEARAYLDNAPPPGRIRSAFATDEARTLRADGPGWSLVARTDDIAFVLLDEEPGEVLPVGRGTELPGLLASLDEIAVRPS
ncbi:hypothetical protein DY218_24915 [Streptomyces triticagri]|uniref:Integral membrane protein n=1 Tax=Streptomyces triticagri TaxID=2293568 RepID=A0A372LZ53_9ACTN|nr:hypothetical protein [Streptomyces triticagri]RFU83966.1 hypothetical protein DY218_24915 [Streptomyces triticagri]